jgi:hypothetical protein
MTTGSYMLLPLTPLGYLLLSNPGCLLLLITNYTLYFYFTFVMSLP